MTLEERRNSQIESRALALGLRVDFLPSKSGVAVARFRGAADAGMMLLFGRKSINSHLDFAELAAHMPKETPK